MHLHCLGCRVGETKRTHTHTSEPMMMPASEGRGAALLGGGAIPIGAPLGGGGSGTVSIPEFAPAVPRGTGTGAAGMVVGRPVRAGMPGWPPWLSFGSQCGGMGAPVALAW